MIEGDNGGGRNAQVCTHATTNESNQLWRFEKVDSRYYRIYAMHHDNLLLWCNSDGTVCMKEGTDTNKSSSAAHWIINMGQIQNRVYDTRYLKATDTTETRLVSADPFVYPGSTTWTITKYVNNTYWSGGYTNASGAKNIYYTIDQGLHDNAHFSDDIFRAGLAWNGISSNVHLTYVPYGETIPSGNDNMVVRFVSYSWTGAYRSVLAQTVPNTGNYENDWSSVTIRVNTNFRAETDDGAVWTLNNISEDQKKAVVMHELGHALKLTHNREQTASDNQSWQTANKQTFPSLMQPQVYVTNGPTYQEAQLFRAKWTLTNFDKSALRAKWGN